MKDFFGQELVAGDYVTMNKREHNNEIRLARVINFTPQRVRVELFAYVPGKMFAGEALMAPERLVKAVPAVVEAFLEREAKWY